MKVIENPMKNEGKTHFEGPLDFPTAHNVYTWSPPRTFLLCVE